jgi:hypothetical protein
MRLRYKILIIYFIFFIFRSEHVYSQSTKDTLAIFYKIIKVGEWLNKITINNEKVKVYYIQVEVTASNFDQAKEFGFKLAIQEALGTFVVTEKVIKFNEVTRNEIVTYSGGYVQDFKIIKENRDNISTTLVMDVWVSESKIANRLLNTSTNKGELDGRKIEAQLSTIVKDKEDAFKLLDIILKDFPSKAFELNIKKTNFQSLRKGTSIVEVPIEIQWSQKYLDSLKEAILLLRDSDELRFKSSIGSRIHNDVTVISIRSLIFGDFFNSGIDASFKDEEIIDLFYLNFNNAPVIKISLNDDFENEIITDCFYLQKSGNLLTKSKFDKQNIHEIKSLEEFYEFNTDRAHFEINEKFKQNKNYLIELNNKNLIRISEITKVKVSIIKKYECKIIK